MQEQQQTNKPHSHIEPENSTPDQNTGAFTSERHTPMGTDTVEVHNLIILDESGSMSGSKKMVISGFNELLQQMKGIEARFPNQQHFVSLVSFNSSGIKHLNWRDALKSLEELNTDLYSPAAMTPLYDAMGLSIGKLRKELENTPNKNVLVTIFTDGLENDSKEFTRVSIRQLVETLKNENWVFTYIGTDHDTVTSREAIGIKIGMHFSNSEVGIQEMFKKEKAMREFYSMKIDKKQAFSDEEDLYSDSK